LKKTLLRDHKLLGREFHKSLEEKRKERTGRKGGDERNKRGVIMNTYMQPAEYIPHYPEGAGGEEKGKSKRGTRKKRRFGIRRKEHARLRKP